MLPAELLRLVMTESLAELKDPPSLNVLDLCAAPGSKSTQLGSWLMSMEPMGFLVANEPDEARAKKLDASLTRMAVTNSIVCTMDGRFISDLVPEAFDAVLVDVPCTCEGNVRKDATSLLRAAGTMRTGPAQHKEELVDRQQAILQSAWRALRPGGCLVLLNVHFCRISSVLLELSDVFPQIAKLWGSYFKKQCAACARFRDRLPVLVL